MDHLGNAKESEDFYEIDKTLLRSRTQNIELNVRMYWGKIC